MRKLAALMVVLDASHAMTWHDTTKAAGRRSALGTVGRRGALGGALAGGIALGTTPAVAAPDWLQDVPTESADETFAAARSERLGQAPSAVMTPSAQRTQSSREASARRRRAGGTPSPRRARVTRDAAI